MCDWKPTYRPDYKCPYKNYRKSRDGTRDLCIFHYSHDDKDLEKFFKGIMAIYKSGKHDFRGFVFPKEFEFKRLKDEVKADHLVFVNADFSEGVFLCETDLSESEFSGKGNTSFRWATFKGQGVTDFSNAEFSGHGTTDFREAKFSGDGTTSFRWAAFSGHGTTDFSNAEFSGHGTTNFSGAKFSGLADTDFSRVKFFGQGQVVFSGKTFQGNSRVYFSTITIEEQDKVTFDGVDLSHLRFLETKIRDINFNEIWWTNREYGKNRPKKRNMVFDETFQTGTTYQALRWVKRIFEKLEKEKKKVDTLVKPIWLKKLRIIGNGTEDNHYDVYRLYNQLRLNYENTGRYHEAGDFFIGEMEMRRRGNFEKPFIRILLHFYRFFSFYGERPLKAFLWLFFLFLGFGFIYRAVGISYPVNEPITYLKDLCNGLMISLDVLALRKIQPLYDLAKTEPIVPLIKAVETVFGALFLSLFLLAMNRKFRRMKD